MGRICIFLSTVFVFLACASKSLPYANGPAMNQKGIEKTFRPILQFMDYKPGMSLADVGAGSGALTVMMASLMDSSTVYIQDIDSTVLVADNLNKIIDYYSKQSGQDLRKKNKFYSKIGDAQRTNLPDSSFDLIYSNATVHSFTSIDSMMIDLAKKLKSGGLLFLRDSFKNDHKEGIFCSDPKCAKPLLTIAEFLDVMNRNGFKLVKRAPDMSGYPLFGFAVAD
jgi:ubiquinone/menaquinone biosynthesis C-methylase UbiE